MKADYSKDIPTVFIVGPTASGKTSLSIKVAKKNHGEIICADSRTIYKGMDIGTAKPRKSEMRGVKHWGIDLVEPKQKFTASDFKNYALDKIDQIKSRGNVPFVVGGTGLYVDSILFDYGFGQKANEKQRSKLNNMTLEELHSYCKDNNIELPTNLMNKRHVIRRIELKGTKLKMNKRPIPNSIIVGITTDKLELRQRIKKRVHDLFDSGAVEEVMAIGDTYGWNIESMTGNIYKLIGKYKDVSIDTSVLEEELCAMDWRLAKRQMTWFRRDKYIKWLTLEDALIYLNDSLAKYR